MKSIEVHICTFNERIKQVPDVLIPPVANVTWLVSFQYTDESFLELIPPILRQRDDVHLTTTQGKGLSANRNHALAMAQSDLIVIADDDARFEEIYFQRVQ